MILDIVVLILLVLLYFFGVPRLGVSKTYSYKDMFKIWLMINAFWMCIFLLFALGGAIT